MSKPSRHENQMSLHQEFPLNMSLLYFAYGSNMWNQQMIERCPQNVKIGTGHLPSFRWIISRRGYATIIKSEGSEVHGVLFQITRSDEDRLDKREGFHSGCYFKAEVIVRFGDIEVDAFTYVDHVSEEGSAKAEYIQKINLALADAQLPESYVTSNIRMFIPDGEAAPADNSNGRLGIA